MAPSTLDGEALNARPTLWELFVAFAGIAVMGFGGVMPWARRMLVEQRHWMTGDDFTEAYALAQFLPGGNILNLAIVVGQRFQGALGALTALFGLLLGPVLIVSLLGLIYFRYGQIPAVHNALAGIAAAAAGLIVSMAAKMAEPLIRKRATLALGMALIAFVGIAINLPLMLVVGILAPLSVAIAWRGLP